MAVLDDAAAWLDVKGAVNRPAYGVMAVTNAVVVAIAPMTVVVLEPRERIEESYRS